MDGFPAPYGEPQRRPHVVPLPNTRRPDSPLPRRNLCAAGLPFDTLQSLLHCDAPHRATMPIESGNSNCPVTVESAAVTRRSYPRTSALPNTRVPDSLAPAHPSEQIAMLPHKL